MFSKLMEYDSNNVDKDVIMKNYVDESLFFEKVENTTKSADKYVQKLNNEILPRCQTAEITSNIVQSRDVDIPIEITQLQSSLIEQLGQNTDIDTNSNNNMKSRNMSQKQHLNFDDSTKNVCKATNSQQLSNFSKLHKSEKYCKNNVGIIHVNAQVSHEKEKDIGKLHNLTVNQSYRVNVKPELSTKKLENIQIKPDDKQILHICKSNVTYREFSFGLEPETCKCQPSTKSFQRGMINDKKLALCEIRNILYGMMNEESSKNNQSNGYLISRLQKVMTTLREIETLELNGSSTLKDLVEEHSINGLCETVLKEKLIEIIETLKDDRMATDFENSNNRVIKQVPTIKNLIYSTSQPTKSSNFSKKNPFVVEVKCAKENFLNHYPNNPSISNNFHEITSKKYISVQEFLNKNSDNFTCSKMSENNRSKNSPVIKESDSKFTLCLNQGGIQNQNVLNSETTEHILNNGISILSSLQNHKPELNYEGKSLMTSFEKQVIPSEPFAGNSISELKTSTMPSEIESHYLKYKEDNCTNCAKINNVCFGANNEISLIRCDENDEIENSLKIKNDIGHTPVHNQIPVHTNIQINIQETISNLLSLSSSDNNEQTDVKIQFKDNEMDGLSNSTEFSVFLGFDPFIRYQHQDSKMFKRLCIIAHLSSKFHKNIRYEMALNQSTLRVSCNRKYKMIGNPLLLRLYGDD